MHIMYAPKPLFSTNNQGNKQNKQKKPNRDYLYFRENEMQTYHTTWQQLF